MYPQYGQGPQPPNLNYLAIANGNQQLAEYLRVVATEIVSYFTTGNPNNLKNFGLTILSDNSFANPAFDELLRLSFDKTQANGGNVRNGAAEATTIWLANLTRQYPDLMNQLDYNTAQKVRSVLQPYVQPQQQFNMPSAAGMGNFSMNNSGVGNMQFGNMARMGTMSNSANISNNATAANRFNMGNEISTPQIPVGMVDRFSPPQNQEVPNVNRDSHKINVAPPKPLLRPTNIPIKDIRVEDRAMKVNVIKDVPTSTHNLETVNETRFKLLSKNCDHMLATGYAMNAIFTEAITETYIPTKHLAYDNVVEYLENVILGKSNKNIRYPASYIPFIESRSVELTKLANILVKQQYGNESAIDNFVEDFNTLVVEIQKIPNGGVEFAEYMVKVLQEHLISTTIHIVEPTDENETIVENDKCIVDIICRKVSMLLVNLSSKEFEAFYSKAMLGLPEWLDNVESWYELHIVTSDNVLYINLAKGSQSLDKIGRVL